MGDEVSGPSFLGEAMDKLARRVGGWPTGAIPYAVEVIGDGPDPQIMLTGQVPIGVKRDGRPKLGTKQPKYRAVVKLSQYRKALPPPASGAAQ